MTRLARAAVYDSPVFVMRARIRRLRSLSFGILDLLCTHHGAPPLGNGVPWHDKESVDADPGVCPPLPHEDPGQGGIGEVGRGSIAVHNMMPGTDPSHEATARDVR